MKILQSIRGRLFIWSFLFVCLLLILTGYTLYFMTQRIIMDSIDYALDSKIEIISGLLHFEEGKIEFELSEAVSGDYTIIKSGSYYKVYIDSKPFAVSPSLGGQEFVFFRNRKDMRFENKGQIAYTSRGPAGERVRVMQHEFDFLERPARIVIAESIEETLSALERIKIIILLVISGGIVIAALTDLLLVNSLLKPLNTFSRKVARITHESLGERMDTPNQSEELLELARAFNDMLERLHHAFELERRIISDASHELKTPLTVIRAQCDVIMQKSRSVEEYVEAIKKIRESEKGMSRTVQNLLSLARLDSGLLKTEMFKPVSVCNCMEKVLRISRVLAAERGISIETRYEDDVIVRGEEEKLSEAFLNIIDNALWYNRENGSVKIIVSRNNTSAEIIISDTGNGIKEENLEKIFQRFFREDTSRSTGGSGLGLSIVKAVIESHNGTIDVKSTPGEGSTFIVNIPVVNQG